MIVTLLQSYMKCALNRLSINNRLNTVLTQLRDKIPVMQRLRSKTLFIVTLIVYAMLNSCNVSSQERPMIWVTQNEREDILQKIAYYPWAQARYNQLLKRTHKFTPQNLTERAERLRRLPLNWDKQPDQFPDFIPQASYDKQQLRKPLQLALQHAIDCSVIYYLTEHNIYAHCAADILHTVLQALKVTKIQETKHFNKGWIIPTNHLLEARIYSSQIPIIYDFMHSWLKKGGKVYDPYKEKLIRFDFKTAQYVFETYAQMALSSGLINNNWPILESASLVHNTLALDNEKLRDKYLMHYLYKDTQHHDSLKTVAKKYKQSGDIWDESLNASISVAYRSLYLMTLLDRIYPDLKLGVRYPYIAQALLTYDQLRFPNGDYPAFGNGDRYYAHSYFKYELAYMSAALNNNEELATLFAHKLDTAIQLGDYNRDTLPNHSMRATPYQTPIQLLWTKSVIVKDDDFSPPPLHSTFHLPFAGFFIQRNLNTSHPKALGLMATTGGGSYVNGHASGIDLELYGKGHILGVESGKAKSGSDVHKHHHSLFAGHNTVISNGASASKGGWMNLGINPIKEVFMEPRPKKNAVSKKHSFTTLSFFDEHNFIAPAQHKRTTAVIRLDNNTGYYIDIFRAKSSHPEQFHDYLYRNIGDNITAKINQSNKDNIYQEAIELNEDAARFQQHLQPNKKHKRFNYQHPGWHYFSDVKTAKAIDTNIQVAFDALKLNKQGVSMHANIVGGLLLDYTQARTPISVIEHPPYNKTPHPIMILRHHGDTWGNPFAVIYEPQNTHQPTAVKRVERLMQGNIFKGLIVSSVVEDIPITQYILLQQGNEQTYSNEQLGIRFTGHFGVITLKNNVLDNIYIGHGKELSFNDTYLAGSKSHFSAYQTYPLK